MNGITIDELRARHAECQAAREKLQREYHDSDLGFAYVLGELEQMIALLDQRQAAADAAPTGTEEEQK